jgi:hypothetical protein
MFKQRSINRELFVILLSAFIVIVSAVDMLGEKARMVNIVAIVAGGIGAGIALGRIVERLRSGKKVTPE